MHRAERSASFRRRPARRDVERDEETAALFSIFFYFLSVTTTAAAYTIYTIYFVYFTWYSIHIVPVRRTPPDVPVLVLYDVRASYRFLVHSLARVPMSDA